MREDINFKGAYMELDFWLISILCPDQPIFLAPGTGNGNPTLAQILGSNLIVGLF